MTVSISTVNIGASANDGTGDTLRTAFDKVNTSFDSVKINVDDLQDLTTANTGWVRVANVTVTNRVLGDLHFYGTDTIYVNGSPVATSAATFTGGNVPGDASFDSIVDSTNPTTGAVKFAGGVGVAKNVFVGGIASVTGNLVAGSTTDTTSASTGSIVTKGGIGVAKSVHVGGALAVDSTSTLTGVVTAAAGIAATSPTSGALVVTGGAGISSDLFIGGNLYVTGSTLADTRTFIVNDNVIDLHTFANLAPLTSDDGKDVGIKFHYYKDADSTAFLGWANDSGALEYYDSGSEVNGVFVGSTYGTGKFGGMNLSNTTPSTSKTTGALVVAGGVGIGGNITAGNINVTGITASSINISGGGLNGVTIGATTASTGRFTSVISTSVNAGTIGNIGATLTGTLSTAAQTNVTSVGTLTGLTVNSTGIAITGNVQATDKTTGDLRVTGGLSVQTGNVWIGGSGGVALTHTGHILPSANVSYNIGSSTAWYGTFYGVSTQAKYADLAEIYSADASYEPGTVVIFGGEQEITTTTVEGDVRVAGAISTDPAYLMNSQATGLPVALRGRIPVKVVGSVRKGDLLVTSTIPGVAISAGTNASNPLAVFAKSLSNKTDADVGVIEAVII